MELVQNPLCLEEIFKKPLIVGASVSADYSSLSPGKCLCLRYTDKHNIRTVAHNGYPGKEILKMIQEKDVKDRSIIIGIDLFFWDSSQVNPEPSLRSLHHLVKWVDKYQIPTVLGDIPELLPGAQPGRSALQEEIHFICRENPNFCLLPLHQLYRKIMNEGGITYKGKEYGLWDLVPDGLHTNEIAGNYLADIIINLLVAHHKKHSS